MKSLTCQRRAWGGTHRGALCVALSFVAAACSLNPIGEDPGIDGDDGTVSPAAADGPAAAPGGGLGDTGGSGADPNSGTPIDPTTGSPTDPNARTPLDPAMPVDGALAGPGGENPTTMPTATTPPGTMTAAPGDPAQNDPMPGAGGAPGVPPDVPAEPEPTPVEDFDGGTFRYGAPDEMGDGGIGDAGEPDAGDTP